MSGLRIFGGTFEVANFWGEKTHCCCERTFRIFNSHISHNLLPPDDVQGVVL